MCVAMYSWTPSVLVVDRQIPGAHWLASLDESVSSFKFNERQSKNKGKKLRKTPVNLRPYTHTPRHTHPSKRNRNDLN